jgi:hypothetical protein
MLTPQISWLTTPIEAASEGYDIDVEIAQPLLRFPEWLPPDYKGRKIDARRTDP